MSSENGKWLPIFIVLEMSSEDDQDWLSVMRYPDRAYYTYGRSTISTDGRGLSCFVDEHSAKMFLMSLYKNVDQLHLWKGLGLFIVDPHDQPRKRPYWNGVVAQVIQIEDIIGRWDEVYLSMKKYLDSRRFIPRAIIEQTCMAL